MIRVAKTIFSQKEQVFFLFIRKTVIISFFLDCSDCVANIVVSSRVTQGFQICAWI